ncbi:MAG: NAD-dependent epimerase/dehydratase family protein [Bacteroidota bacterium]|nr:NAD-dependent epimerase/dehydratase family protein [Bacteroidota bacterium]
MILVTGATGLVGGNLIWQLLQDNGRVAAIRRAASNLESLRTIFSFYTSTPDLFLARIDWRIADMLDENSIRTAMHDISIVYHCAASVSLANDADALFNTNVTGTRNVVRAALESNIDKFCFVSSIAACGKAAGNEPVDENSTWVDSPYRSPYSRSKYNSEQELWNGIRSGLNAVIVNPGVILGISGTDTGSSQLFSQVQKGLLFYTNGGSGYVDVRDVVKAMILLTQSDITGERFILTGENCSNKEILGWMADGFGKRRPVFNVGKRMLWFAGFLSELLGKVCHFTPLIDRGTARTATNREYYSNRKIKDTLNFRFSSVENSIHQICDFRLKSNSEHSNLSKTIH